MPAAIVPASRWLGAACTACVAIAPLNAASDIEGSRRRSAARNRSRDRPTRLRAASSERPNSAPIWAKLRSWKKRNTIASRSTTVSRFNSSSSSGSIRAQSSRWPAPAISAWIVSGLAARDSCFFSDDSFFHGIHRGEARHSQQPPSHRDSSADGCGLFAQDQEHCLRHIFGQMRIMHLPKRRRIDQRQIPANQFPQRLRDPAAVYSCRSCWSSLMRTSYP